MSNLYYPFPLKSYQTLKEYALQSMSKFEGDSIYVERLSANSDAVRTLNDELSSYGLKTTSVIAFKRKGFFDITHDHVHVDRKIRSVDFELIHCSLVLPIQGCDSTYMYWLEGEYEESTLSANEEIKYSDIKWLSNPKLMDKVEISKFPMLTRVDVPHNATSRHDNSYRLVLTIRFANNPQFEEVVEKIQKNNRLI